MMETSSAAMPMRLICSVYRLSSSGTLRVAIPLLELLGIQGGLQILKDVDAAARQHVKERKEYEKLMAHHMRGIVNDDLRLYLPQTRYLSEVCLYDMDAPLL